jgi:TolB protein
VRSIYAILIAMALIFTALPSHARVYIDISSPQTTLPIAVQEFAGPSGAEITDIVTDDLNFTGLFYCLNRAAFIENASQPFSPGNWTIIGAEAVVKGHTEKTGKEIKATVSLYDVSEGREIMRKQYSSEESLIRPLAHTISGDIYKQITGSEAVFKTKIAFIGEKDGRKTIYISDWDGQRTKAPGIDAPLLLSPHWSADGGRLVYSSERKRQWGIYILDFSSMSEKLIFSGGGTNIAGDFSPDGRAFVFSSSKEGSQDLYIYDISSQKTRRLTSSRGIDVSPAVSPDGGRIAFVSDRGGSPQIYIMDKNGYNIERITFGSSYNTSPVWSPDGKRLAFVRREEGKNQIFTISPDGSGVMKLTEKGNNEDPSFSPDGRYIAFTSDREGPKGIYIMRANGEGQKRITPKGIRASGPRWSPN